jgi:dCTP deaminase
MINFSGSLVFKDYLDFNKRKKILYDKFSLNQIQPSSVDLTLSEECYEINASFLSSTNYVRDNLKKIKIKRIDLNKKYLFRKNKTFLIRLNETLNLKGNYFGMCNPKSSTGRLDIFCRTILNFSDEYEKIPLNYKGEMFIEITSRSFDIEIQKGDSLNQMRLISNRHLYVKDKELKLIHKKKFLTLDENNKKIKPYISNGLKIGVDLSCDAQINAYVAKKNSPPLSYRKIKSHKIKDFWKPLKSLDGKLIIEKNKFYILKSKQKIQIPENMAGEMIPYDTGIGDFRAHYAGFFDPGFGKKFGSYAVLEVKTNEVSFLLEDGQSIARIKYEFLNKKTKVLYGSNINSNYQHQSLALSKHFV